MVEAFVGSTRADVWHLFASDLRMALVDACVMDQIRVMHHYGSDETISPADIMDARDEFVAALASGVGRRGRMKLRYTIDGTGY